MTTPAEQSATSPARAGTTKITISLLTGAVACLATLQIFAFHWGVVTPDTVAQYGQALAGRYDDWHPPVMAWLWRGLMQVYGRGSAPFLLFDIALYWGGGLLIAATLAARGHRRSAWSVILVLALPIQFGQIGAILKDPLLASALLAATGLILARPAPSSRVAAGLLLILAAATRANGLLAAVPLVPLLAPTGWQRQRTRLIILLAVGALAFTLCNAAISRALEARRTDPFLALVNFDLAGIVANKGPNFHPAASADALRTCYSPALTDSCGAAQDALRAALARSHRSGAGLWLSAIAHAPVAWARHRIAHVNRNWRFLVADVPDDAFYVMSEPNELGLRYHPNRVAILLQHAGRWLALSPLGRPATWIAVALGLLFLGRSAAVRALAGSAALYGGGYFLVSVAPDLRYNLWTLVAGMLATILHIAEKDRMIAFLPAVLVMAAELIWLALQLPPL